MGVEHVSWAHTKFQSSTAHWLQARDHMRHASQHLPVCCLATLSPTHTAPSQDLWNPAQLWLAECNCNRQTWEAIEAAGFSSLKLERFQATPNPLFALIAPHIAGVAVK